MDYCGIIEKFLVNSLREIKSRLPDELHRWDSTSFVESKDGDINIRYGTAPLDQIARVMSLTPSTAIKSFSQDFSQDSLLDKYVNLYSVENNGGRYYWLEPFVIARCLLQDYIRIVNSIEPNIEKIRYISQIFSEGWTSGVTKMSVFSVIRGFCSDEPLFELKNNLRIREMSSPEICRLLEEQWHSQQLDDGVPRNKFIVEKQVNIPIGMVSDPTIQIEDEFKQVLTMLRLCKSDMVEFENTYCRPVNFGQWSPRIGNRGKIHKRSPYTQTYRAEGGDRALMQGVYESILASGNKKQIRIALDRINYASQRENIVEKLVDAAIALEAIYGDGRGAATYKIAIRCAAYLGKNLSQRVQMMKDVERIYKLRSEVVHGSKSAGAADIQYYVEMSLDIARQSALKLLDGVRRMGKVPEAEYFDRLLLGAEHTH